MAWFAAQVNACTNKNKTAQKYNAVLDNDIDLCGYSWSPIGDGGSYHVYGGVFDGQGHTVFNLYINDATNRYRALFGDLTNGATIKNLTVRGSVTSTYDTTTGGRIAGVVGYASGSKASPIYITNVTNYADVTGCSKYAAGICGYAGTYVYIDRCANYGNVTLSHNTNTKGTDAAGIAYLNNVNSSITNSYNCGTIVANNNVGGIYVATVKAPVSNVYNTGRVHATRTNNSGYSCHGAIRPTANTTTETENVTNAYANEDFLFNELNTTIITDSEAWTGGEIAYKLGEAFGQEIGVDPLPVIGGMMVYEIELPDGSKYYSNTNETYGEYVRENLTPGKMGTICLPYASFRTFDATFYRILHKTLDGAGQPLNLVLEEVTDLEPGMPYIFVPETNTLRIWYAESTQVLSPDHFNGLYGTFVDISDGAAGDPNNVLEGNYMVSNNMFRKCADYCSLPANRAYIKMNEVALQGSANAPAPVQGRRQMTISGNDAPQVTTDMENIGAKREATGIYDILGRRVNIKDGVAPGVYIINGKKVIK